LTAGTNFPFAEGHLQKASAANREDVMTISKFLVSAAALALLAAPALAADSTSSALKTTTIDGQNVITDANGMTLYTFDKDTAGTSNCSGKCAKAWPPALAPASAMVSGDFSTIKRTDDGDLQWAYKGMPLYLWIKDKKPGDETGDGVGNVWHTAVEK
jgi:predicted lipoprotein with Yx(FWY)xxD motif